MTEQRLRPAVQWVLLDCDRGLLAAAVLAAVFLLTFGLIRVGTITVDPSSVAGSVFGSGAVAGLFTLLTVVLSINQLILSRVFGSPRDFREEYEASVGLRSTVAEISGAETLPNDPSDFLVVVGQALQVQAEHLSGAYGDTVQSDVDEYVSSMVAYGGHLRDLGREEGSTAAVTRMLGGEYARVIARTEEMQRRHGDELNEDDTATLESLSRLVEVVAVARQYLKTMTIQQNLALLSGQIAVTGMVALLTAIYVALTYRTSGSVSVDPRLLPWITSAGVTVVISPIVVLLVHVLRLSTVMWYTVSVGPFVPPEQ